MSERACALILSSLPQGGLHDEANVARVAIHSPSVCACPRANFYAILTKRRQYHKPPTLCGVFVMGRPVSAKDRVLDQIRRRGGYVRHRDLRTERLDPHILRMLMDEGKVDRVRRGFYRLIDEGGAHDSLAAVAAAAPNGVICLLSALDYYNLTTTTPSKVHLAIPRKARPPRIEYPPVRVVRYGDRSFSYGVTSVMVAGQSVPIYTREKTLADAFHFVNVVGRDVAIEALKTYLRQPGRDVDALLAAAEVCRVRSQIFSYLSVLL